MAPERVENFLIKPEEFFYGRVNEASESLRLCLGVELEFYIVNLLCQFINPDNLKKNLGGEDVLETPLVFILQRALDSDDPDKKLRLLRSLGDVSLYVAGYFQDFFNRKTFDINYYIEMGTHAYDHVQIILKEQNPSKAAVYSDLSKNFTSLVDLVAEVSETSWRESAKNLLAIYDRWTRCNSNRLLKILEKEGITPIHVNTKIAQ